MDVIGDGGEVTVASGDGDVVKGHGLDVVDGGVCDEAEGGGLVGREGAVGEGVKGDDGVLVVGVCAESVLAIGEGLEEGVVRVAEAAVEVKEVEILRGVGADTGEVEQDFAEVDVSSASVGDGEVEVVSADAEGHGHRLQCCRRGGLGRRCHR